MIYFFVAEGDTSRQQSVRTHQWEYLGHVKAGKNQHVFPQRFSSLKPPSSDGKRKR